MALVNFAKLVLVLVLVCGATTAAPTAQQVNPGTDTEIFPSEKLPVSGVEETKQTSEDTLPSRLRAGGTAALEETGKIIRTATMLPVETLQLIRLLTVPLLNATLSVPANVLEGAATMSLSGLQGAGASARSSANNVLSLLSSLKEVKHHLVPHIAIQKNITIGSFSLHKNFEIGAASAAKPPVTTAAPEVYPEPTTAPPVVDPVTEPPKVAAVTPAPVVPAPPVPVAVTPVVVAPVVVPPAVVSGGDQVQIANVGGSKPEVIVQENTDTPAVPVAVAPAVVVPPGGDDVQIANVVHSDSTARVSEESH